VSQRGRRVADSFVVVGLGGAWASVAIAGEVAKHGRDGESCQVAKSMI